jgi:hypothetical protein
MEESNGTTVAGLANGTSSSSLDGLSEPTNIIVDSSNNIYVLDRDSQRILF